MLRREICVNLKAPDRGLAELRGALLAFLNSPDAPLCAEKPAHMGAKVCISLPATQLKPHQWNSSLRPRIDSELAVRTQSSSPQPGCWRSVTSFVSCQLISDQSQDVQSADCRRKITSWFQQAARTSAGQQRNCTMAVAAKLLKSCFEF